MARLTAATAAVPGAMPRARFTSSCTATTATATTNSPRTMRRIRCWSGVCPPIPSATSAATLPYAVARPVSVTSPRARPATTREPAWMSWPTLRGQGSDSPVRWDSSTVTPPSTMRASANTRSPSRTTTRSPGTRSSVGSSRSAPSRMTRATGATAARSAASARADRASSSTSTARTGSSAANRIAASSRWPSSRSSPPATSSMSAMGSAIIASAWRARCQRGASTRRFGPADARRAAASAELRPRSPKSAPLHGSLHGRRRCINRAGGQRCAAHSRESSSRSAGCAIAIRARARSASVLP